MGQKLLRLYEFMEDEKGFPGKMELARRTKIPSAMAASTPDTPENVRAFVAVIREFTGKTPPG